MSTANHNILYFVHIPGTCLLNTAICLWKAPKALRDADFVAAVCLNFGAAESCFIRGCLNCKPILRPDPVQDAKTVQSGT
jgi:hypothetical protein